MCIELYGPCGGGLYRALLALWVEGCIELRGVEGCIELHGPWRVV